MPQRVIGVGIGLLDLAGLHIAGGVTALRPPHRCGYPTLPLLAASHAIT